MRRLIMCQESPNAVKREHLDSYRAKLSASEQQRIADAEIRTEIRRADEIADARLSGELRGR